MHNKTVERKKAIKNLANRWAWETIKAHAYADKNIRITRVS